MTLTTDELIKEECWCASIRECDYCAGICGRCSRLQGRLDVYELMDKRDCYMKYGGIKCWICEEIAKIKQVIYQSPNSQNEVSDCCLINSSSVDDKIPSSNTTPFADATEMGNQEDRGSNICECGHKSILHFENDDFVFANECAFCRCHKFKAQAGGK